MSAFIFNLFSTVYDAPSRSPRAKFVSYEAELRCSPGLATCPSCRTQVTTEVTFKAGTFAWLMCLVFVLCGWEAFKHFSLVVFCTPASITHSISKKYEISVWFFPPHRLVLGCCLIPFFINHFKDAYHSCPRCQRVLHVHKKRCCEWTHNCWSQMHV